jgi:hypothetical protein
VAGEGLRLGLTHVQPFRCVADATRMPDAGCDKMHVVRRDTWVCFGARFRPNISIHWLWLFRPFPIRRKSVRPQLNAENFARDNEGRTTAQFSDLQNIDAFH